MVSIEDVALTELGAVSPSNCQRIFGFLWTGFFFLALLFFQNEEGFIENFF